MNTIKPQLKADRDLCSEMRQALTESFVFNVAQNVELKHELCCIVYFRIFAKGHNVPLYRRRFVVRAVLV